MTPTPNSAQIFSGEFCHSLDPKNRVTIPAKWRVTDADEFHLFRDRSGNFIRVMPPVQFRAVAAKLAANPSIAPKDQSASLRYFYSQAQSAVADKQGRLLVPEEFSKAIGLAGEVTLVGSLDTFELWNPSAWAQVKQAEASTFDRVADLLGL